jgi:hypothetical protein
MRVGCPEGNKVRLCPARAIMIKREITPYLWLNLPVLANAKEDKPEHQQDGSGYHHPIRIFIAESMLIRAPYFFVSASQPSSRA